MAVEFLWNAAFWKTAAEFAPIVTTGIALAAAIIALCAIRARTSRNVCFSLTYCYIYFPLSGGSNGQRQRRINVS